MNSATENSASVDNTGSPVSEATGTSSPLLSANTSLNNVSMQSIGSELSPASTPPLSVDESTPSSTKSGLTVESSEASIVTSSSQDITTKTTSSTEVVANAVTTSTTTPNATGDYGIKRTIVNTSKEVAKTESDFSQTISVLGSQSNAGNVRNVTSTSSTSTIPTVVGNNRGNQTARAMSNKPNRRSPVYGIQTIPVLSGMCQPVTNQQSTATTNVYVSSDQPQVIVKVLI